MNKDDRPLDDAGLDYALSEDLPPLPQPLPAADLGLDGAEGIATATNSNAADSNVPRFAYKTEKHGASLYITGVECARDQKSKAFGLQLGSGSACSVKQVLPYARCVNAPQDVIRDGDVAPPRATGRSGSSARCCSSRARCWWRCSSPTWASPPPSSSSSEQLASSP